MAAKAARNAPAPTPAKAVSTAPAPAPVAAPAAPKRKLSYKEQRELDELPARIAALEAEQAALNEALAGTALYAGPADKIAATHARHGAIDDELLALMERWETLGG
jgi:ATP-binding cassette subfamily F protein uup